MSYRQIIREAIKRGELPQLPGSVAVVNVKHDDWCKIFRGGVCNCNPNIEIVYKPVSRPRNGARNDI